jgi:hypothetical protein
MAKLPEDPFLADLPDSLKQFPVCPSIDDRDLVLGQYMSEWSYLEFILLQLFHTLLGTKPEISFALFSTGFKSNTLKELLPALGHFQLLESGQKQLKGLCERYNDAALKRNKIVHARWTLESVSNDPNSLQWVRICSPVNPITLNEIYDKSNQKTCSKYRFTLNQLFNACKDTRQLTNDIGSFNQLVSQRIKATSPEKP